MIAPRPDRRPEAGLYNRRMSDEEATTTRSRPGTITVPRWVQLAVLPVLLIVGWLLLGRIGEAVFIFVVATLLALVLNPFVHVLQRARIPRALAVAIVYLVAIGILAGIIALVIPPLVRQIRALLDALPGMAQQARAGVRSLQSLANRFHLRHQRLPRAPEGRHVGGHLPARRLAQPARHRRLGGAHGHDHGGHRGDLDLHAARR